LQRLFFTHHNQELSIIILISKESATSDAFGGFARFATQSKESGSSVRTILSDSLSASTDRTLRTTVDLRSNVCDINLPVRVSERSSAVVSADFC
jgi:hypothetical protein